jgi:hypothetical protein
VAAPFTLPTTPVRSLLGLLRRVRADPETAAVSDLRALLARAPRIRDMPTDAAARVVARRDVPLASLGEQVLAIYTEYLRYCLQDHHLTVEELADLGHLRLLLRIDRNDADLVQRRLAREVYSRTVEQVLTDSTIDDGEREFLAKLRAELNLPDSVADNIETMKAKQREARDSVPPRRSRER